MNTTNFNNKDDNKLEFDDMLVLYAIGALNPEESEVVEAKVQNNPELQAKVEQMRTFDTKMKKNLTVIVPPYYSAQETALMNLFKGLTHQEIGIIMGISETQVDQLLSQTCLELNKNL